MCEGSKKKYYSTLSMSPVKNSILSTSLYFVAFLISCLSTHMGVAFSKFLEKRSGAKRFIIIMVSVSKTAKPQLPQRKVHKVFEETLVKWEKEEEKRVLFDFNYFRIVLCFVSQSFFISFVVLFHFILHTQGPSIERE